MAVEAHVNTHTMPTSTGSQTVSPTMGFDPKAVLFMGNRRTLSSGAPDAAWWFGAAASAADERCVGFESEDASTASDVGAIQANAQSMTGLLANNAVDLVADFTSFDTSPQGFTYNLSDAPASASLTGYCLLGGDVTGIQTFVFNLGAATSGNKSVTGLSGTPACVLFFSAAALTGDTLAATSASAIPMLGWMCADGTQGYAMTRHTDAQPTMSTFRRQRTDKCFGLFSGTTEFAEAHFVSMDANGFTINLVNANLLNLRVYGCVIYGGLWHAGSFLSSTGTGTTGITTTGVAPKVLFLQTYGLGANTTTQTGGKRGAGMADGTNQCCTSYDDLDAQANSIADSAYHTQRSLISMTAGTPTLDDIYTTILDAQGFTYNHITASGVAIEILYLVGGDTFVAGGEPSLLSKWVA
jgi:hypothetical protein